MIKTKEPKHQCDDCGWVGLESELRCELADIPDLWERIDPGSMVPSGECPECGSLAYPAKKSKKPTIPKKDRTLKRLNEEVTKLKALLDDPQPGLMSWVSFYGERMKWITAFWREN